MYLNFLIPQYVFFPYGTDVLRDKVKVISKFFKVKLFISDLVEKRNGGMAVVVLILKIRR